MMKTAAIGRMDDVTKLLPTQRRDSLGYVAHAGFLSTGEPESVLFEISRFEYFLNLP